MDPQDDRIAAFHRLHASGCFVMPNPWDVGSARALAQSGVPGHRHDQRRVGLDARPDRRPGHARGGARPPASCGRRRRASGQRGLRGWLRDRPRWGSRERRSLRPPGSRDSRSRTSRVPRRAAPRPRPRGREGRRRPPRDRRDRDRGAADRALGGLRRRRRDIDETVRRLRAYADVGADCVYPRIGASSTSPRRLRARAHAREPAHQRAVHHGRRGSGRASGGSAWAARSLAPRGGGSGPRRRSPTREPSPLRRAAERRWPARRLRSGSGAG